MKIAQNVTDLENVVVRELVNVKLAAGKGVETVTMPADAPSVTVAVNVSTVEKVDMKTATQGQDDQNTSGTSFAEWTTAYFACDNLVNGRDLGNDNHVHATRVESANQENLSRRI